ncbi:MAG: histidine phosphatase family protein [Sphaerochaetaceae bacterium]|nr:histidine phosphatase family protein [Spirochaetales bacterium]MDY5498577.1 histidine phosphatase family protein [Sphaerochaetaceae bacterium]
MLLYVTRHGKTLNNSTGRISGIVDVPLSPEGVEEARGLARKLCEGRNRYRILHVVSSNLVRARQTAEIVAKALSLPVTVDSLFHEVSFGSDEGSLFSERPYQERKDEPFSRFTGGESLVDAACRVYPALDEMRKMYTGNVLLVTHGMLARVIATYFHSYTIEQLKSSLMPNCSLACYDMEQAERHPVPESEPFRGIAGVRSSLGV